jgi:hypothetical protein
MALVLGGGQIALADGPQARVGKSIPVSRVIGNKDLFKKSTPEETVNFIKYLARKKGLDLHEKEEKRRDHDSWDLNSDTARSLILGGQRKIVLAGDHSYIDRLNREISSGMDSGMEVGVFVADGSVSLADLIDVCSPGIRLFGRIPVSGPGIGLLVGGPRSAIIKLSELDFCFWIGPYKPDYKLNANDIHTGAINWTVGFWGSFDPDYEKELEACGAQIVTSGEGSFFIGASATWEQIQVIKNWWWVGDLMRPRPVEENSLEN